MQTTLTNWAPDPRLATDATETMNCTTRRDSNGWLNMFASTDSALSRVYQGANVDTSDLAGWQDGIAVPAGDLVFAVKVKSEATTQAQAVLVPVRDGAMVLSTKPAATSDAAGERLLTVEFTVPSACTLSWCVRSRTAGATIGVRDLIVCTKDDWNQLQLMGLDYFDYSTLPA
ncbi:hypothetical protein [Bifidobacterium cuniculi]|uniref:Uncharacterized protein n=1 Tax=Bifidobacterium cuniculi TaxID=1688 RepID=A0A087B418_9BIFI|nr:hypothetical protein [Bifidobacterium cuniculi]KFI65768.1 hypothetical protein BCUN_0263 [Bifidobacterium cuniculi]